jgi:hypothetical protein
MGAHARRTADMWGRLVGRCAPFSAHKATHRHVGPPCQPHDLVRLRLLLLLSGGAISSDQYSSFCWDRAAIPAAEGCGRTFLALGYNYRGHSSFDPQVPVVGTSTSP